MEPLQGGGEVLAPISCSQQLCFLTEIAYLEKSYAFGMSTCVCNYCAHVFDYACMFVWIHTCVQVHRHTRTCMSQGQRSTLGVLPQKSPILFPEAEFPISLSPAKLTGLAVQSVPGGSPCVCPSGLPF